MPGVALAGRPERQLRPRLHAGIEDDLLVDPDEASAAADRGRDALEELTERHRLSRARRVVDPARPLLGDADEPEAEIARVDQLHRLRRRSGREDVASLGQAARPVGEAVGRIMGADDQSRAYDRGPVVEDGPDDALCSDLEAAVLLEVELLRLRLGRVDHGRVLGDRPGRIRVDRDRRDEREVADLVCEQLGVAPDVARQMRRIEVDGGVPGASTQGVEVAGEVAAHLLRFGVEVGVRPAAVEERHLVPGRERGVDDGAAEEPRPA
jgi:hypothetical protein